MEIGRGLRHLSTQSESEYDDLDYRPNAEDTLMFLGYCLRAYEITNGEPLFVDNELVKELIFQSVENDTVPAIVIGAKGEAVVLQGDIRSLNETE